MCAGDWDAINYQHVPSQAMLIYGKNSRKRQKEGEENQTGAFLRHDKERFTEYREQVKVGEAKINTTGIQPHQLVQTYMGYGDTRLDETVELQWTAMVQKLALTGDLGSSMSIVDVSGSMSGEPMEVAIALGLVASSLSEAPFKNTVITFHEQPSLVRITGDTLKEKVKQLESAPWGGSTDFEASLRLVLDMAIACGVHPSKMVKTLFVFTDMQFNSASSRPEQTIYKNCKALYAKAGYPFPNIVFWNLRASEKNAFPVQVSQYGTAFVSGFSSDLLKVFMSGITFTPIHILTELLKKYEVQVAPTEA
jgi:Mg-chelatase subunit ChlD